MRKNLKIFILISGLAISFLISIIVWRSIGFTYSFSEQIDGFYFDNNLSHNNNIIRFISFIFIPIVFFYILLNKLFYKNNFFYLFKNNFKKDVFSTNLHCKLLLVVFSLIILSNYLSRDLILLKVDYFHEGLTLSAAFNHFKTNEFWKSSFLSNSLLSDIYTAYIPWKFFELNSIGSYRIFHEFLRLLTEIIIIFFIYKLSLVYDFKKNSQNIFLISTLFFSLSLNRDLTELFYPFRYRDIPIFILIILSIDYLKFNRLVYLTPVLIGLISLFTLFWSLDRGIYFFVGVFALLFISILKKRYFDLILILFGFTTSLIIIFLIFDTAELINFYNNSLIILKNFDVFAGSTYPTLFDLKNEHSSRGTVNLFIIILNSFFVIYFSLNKDISLKENSKIIILFIFIMSCVIYKSALSVPDSYHMKQSIFLSKVFLFSNILYVSLQNNFLIKKKLIYLIPLIIFFTSLYNFNDFNLKNMTSFNERNLKYAKLNDENFVDKKYIDLRNFILKNYKVNCIQVFSYDTIIPYLIKKKSCTKYNFLYVVSSNNAKKSMKEELINNKPEIIIFNKDYSFLNLRPIEEKFDDIFLYIKDNYVDDKEFKNWVIYIKRS